MNIVDYDKLRTEMERKNDLKDSCQDLDDFPTFVEMLSISPVSVSKLEKLKDELDGLLIELHELCNGFISQDTPLKFYQDSDGGSMLITTGSESLGTWKSRLKKMKTNLHFDPVAMKIIDDKLEELYELKSL